MRKLTLSTLLLSSIVITACSGGGGGGDNNQSNPIPETKLTNSDLIISKDSFKKGELNRSDIMSGDKKVGELSGYNRNYSFNGAFKKEDNIDMVIVDGGIKFAIGKVTDVIGGLTGKALSLALKTAWNVSKDPTRDIFYFGYETPEANIPQKGIVTYEGKASRYDNFTSRVRNMGDVRLVANFDNKTIKGELDITYPARNISLHEAPIVGNSFNGKAVTEGNFPFFISREGQYEGKFFGPNAEEVAGKATFDESVKDLNTSFSAERTK
ncbi:Slam-dependent surface lipoprotein [Aggregatibacter aphrophilus]|uniref:Slam-dependent surface lipoprotein n=1 Tax=Aggregatibacter aphrophilus TaxID=732 RepID=UPI000D65C8E2|nr:Slam-dependent surface lipoprotein [Aggregatibacter aphrophilus]